MHSLQPAFNSIKIHKYILTMYVLHQNGLHAPFCSAQDCESANIKCSVFWACSKNSKILIKHQVYSFGVWSNFHQFWVICKKMRYWYHQKEQSILSEMKSLTFLYLVHFSSRVELIWATAHHSIASSPPLFFATRTQRNARTDIRKRKNRAWYPLQGY